MDGAPLNRLAWRQARAGLRLPEWRALLLALLLAISLASLLALLGDRLERSLQRQSAELLGADLVLHGTRPLNPTHHRRARAAGLNSTGVTEFSTMLGHGDQLLLTSLRAVETPYPLRGRIRAAPATAALPAPGQIWVEQAVLERLAAAPGDRLQVGRSQLVIAAVIEQAPDRGLGFGSFSPQVLISAQDLAATGLLGPGARVRYRQLFAGEPKAIAAFAQQLRRDLRTGERLSSPQAAQNISGGALGNASRYLRLGALLALLLAALTVALSLRRYTLSAHDRAALLLSLGLTPRQLLQLYLRQLLLAWLLCAILGTLLALLLEALAMQGLAPLLPQPVPAATPWLYLSGPLLGLLTLLTLGLPPLLAMSQVSVMRLLQRRPPPATLSGRGLQLAAGAACALLLFAYLGDLKLSLLLLGGILLSAWLLGLAGSWLLQCCARLLARRLRLGRLLQLRIRQQRRWHRLQVPTMSLLLALVAIALLSRNDLLQRWQTQLPADTPDHFVINIQQWEQAPLAEFLAARQVEARLYPMIRGRIVSLNGEAAATAFTAEQKRHNALNRELNLTWDHELATSNRLLTGQWHGRQRGEAVISVEAEMATQLGLGLGDRLGFNIGDQALAATISSIRQVRWESFEPNFYVIFNPGALDNLPLSYITSFHAGARHPTLARELLQRFPTLTLIDVRQLLEQARQVIGRLVDTSGLVMGMTLLAGLLLLFSSLTQELEQRRYENALLQTLGATPRQSRQLDLLEFALLGLVCGLLAAILTELALWPLHSRLLGIEPVLHPPYWLLLPLLATALFLLIGLLGRRQLNQRHSYRLLRGGSWGNR